MDLEKLKQSLKLHGVSDEALNKALADAEGGSDDDSLVKALALLKEVAERDMTEQVEALTKSLEASEEQAATIAAGADKVLDATMEQLGALNKGMQALGDAVVAQGKAIQGIVAQLNGQDEKIAKALDAPLPPKAQGAVPVPSPFDGADPSTSPMAQRTEMLAKAQQVQRNPNASDALKGEAATCIASLESGVSVSELAQRYPAFAK